MDDKEILDIQNLFHGLDISKEQNNIIQLEYCSALLMKYSQEGVNIYNYAPKEEYENLINQGLELFSKRKRKFFIKKLIFNFFTALAVGLFAYMYLKFSFLKSLVFFAVAFFVEYLIKKTINKIIFCVETKKVYKKYVKEDLLNIRKSEDESKLWK